MSRLIQSLMNHAIHKREQTALSWKTGELDYGQLLAEVLCFCELLEEYEGKTIALSLENSPAWVVIDLACLIANVCCVPLPQFFTQAQKNHAMQSSGSAALINDTGKGEGWYECCGFSLSLLQLDSSNVVELPKGTCKITFTSGTTGHPKGVCLSQQAMENVAESLLSLLGNEVAQVTAAVLPLSILLENVAGCYTTLMAGACYNIHSQAEIGFHSSVDFDQFRQYLLDEKITSCILVPELLRGLMQSVSQAPSQFNHLKYIAVGGSRVSQQLLEQANALGLPVYQGYGLSEAGSVVTVNTPALNHQGSVGKVLPHIHLRISDQGEIIIRDPSFLGYVGETLMDQDFLTHDIGYIDDDGYVFVTGRSNSVLINAFGRNISPEWPECELLAQAVIGQALVLGDGELELSALIVPVSQYVTREQMKNAVNQANTKLPHYAQVKHWKTVAPFSVKLNQLTGNGRMRRDIILRDYADSMTATQVI